MAGTGIVAVPAAVGDIHPRCRAVNVFAAVARPGVTAVVARVADDLAEQQAGARTDRGAFPAVVPEIAAVVADDRAGNPAEHRAIDGLRPEDLGPRGSEGDQGKSES